MASEVAAGMAVVNAEDFLLRSFYVAVAFITPAGQDVQYGATCYRCGSFAYTGSRVGAARRVVHRGGCQVGLLLECEVAETVRGGRRPERGEVGGGS